MKRTDYQKPAMSVVELQYRSQILAGSNVKGNALRGGGSDEDYEGDVR